MAKKSKAQKKRGGNGKARASAELKAVIYTARPDVTAVVHSHSPTVVAFSVTQVPLRPIRAAFFYPEVPVFDTRASAGWTNLLISNSALGKALAQTLGKNSVALLRGH